MNYCFQKCFALILALAMVLSLLSVNAFAAEQDGLNQFGADLSKEDSEVVLRSDIDDIVKRYLYASLSEEELKVYRKMLNDITEDELTRMETPPLSGPAGTAATWSFDVDSHTLTIAGTGAVEMQKVVKEGDITGAEPLYMDNFSYADNKYHVTKVVVEEGITDLGPYTFGMMQKLEEVSLPTTLRVIGESAFSYCTELSSITIPDGVTTIGDGAFNGASALSAITLPDSVTAIGAYAFAWDENLTSIKLGKGLESVGDSAFLDTGVKSLTFPATLKSLGVSPFDSAANLTKLTFEGDAPQLAEGEVLVNDVPENFKIYYNGKSKGWTDAVKKQFGHVGYEGKYVPFYQIGAPAKPAVASLTNAAAGKVMVKWDKVADAKSYQVQYATKKSMKDAKSVTVTKASATLSKLKKGTKYYVRVMAKNDKGDSRWSAVKSVTVKK